MLQTTRTAISAEHVQSMVVVSDPSKIPNSPDYIRGVSNLREQDHLRWLQELEASVREQREFTLATDPHHCAFGKWYDGSPRAIPWQTC